MTVFKNKHYTKRDYECTNVVACIGESAPSTDWVECNADVLIGLTRLHILDGVQYFGYL